MFLPFHSKQYRASAHLNKGMPIRSDWASDPNQSLLPLTVKRGRVETLQQKFHRCDRDAIGLKSDSKITDVSLADKVKKHAYIGLNDVICIAYPAKGHDYAAILDDACGTNYG